ncbi:MAG: IS3 family transposase [Actinomycetia bacterium]|nr:IS3 family transposase [Actinomycetes bacterium]
MSKYQFIDAQKAQFPIWLLCRILEVPESSYYDWNREGRDRHECRQAARADMTDKIRQVHADSDGTYGSPRVRSELNDNGTVVTKRRVAELMAASGIVGLSGREHITGTTRRDRLAAPFPDLVDRNFNPPTPDVVWYGDITYIWVDAKFWYLATVIDAATKEVLGWRFADHMETSLVSDALRAAVARRGGNVDGVIFHTDRGSQYTSHEFGKLCRSLNIRQSMGRTGICFDNAAAESFFATLKRELIHRYQWNNVKELRQSLFAWIESWYNRTRRHTTIGMKTPHQAYTDYTNSRAA